MDLVRGISARVYPVGRLDYASEGLVLLTNDGDLAQKLMHASSHLPKTYLVKVAGKPGAEALAKLRSGVTIPLDGKHGRTRRVKTAPARIRLARDAPNPWYEVTLIEGRNRQIRRMFEQVGHRVEKIKRLRYGNLELDVEPGKWRSLSLPEVQRLKNLAARNTRPEFKPVRDTREADEEP
jgi:23S rRNA pseudouridine2605 synthase